MENKPLILTDSREHRKAIKKILAQFDRAGVDYLISKLPYGDYMSYDNPRLVIDRKACFTELCSNVCQQHDRFMREIKGANQHGIKIVFLIEHSRNYHTLEDVRTWINPRLKESPMAVSGERLYKILSSIQERNDVDFQFCDKSVTGIRIMDILGVKR